MRTSIDSRELIVLDAMKASVNCTHHKPAMQGLWQPSLPGQQELIGILFLNSLLTTRASVGDAQVYWADSFARSGYPSFRIDFPGYGDTAGDLPPDLISYIDTGGYAPLTSAIMRELMDRFHLGGVVIAGLCGGAVSAQFTAVAAGPMCKGMVLLDPHFHLPLTPTVETWHNMRHSILGPIARSRLGSVLRAQLRHLQAFCGRQFKRSLPSNANHSLLKCWKTLASSGMPILIFRAVSEVIERDFDYFRHIVEVAGPNGRIQIERIEGAGHNFATVAGRTAVCQRTEEWLHKYFPLEEHSRAAAGSQSAEKQACKSGMQPC